MPAPARPDNRGPGLAGNGRKVGVAAALVTAVAALVGPEVASSINQGLDVDEGNRLVAYQDSVGIWTGCRGVIRVGGRPVPPRYRFTPEECAMLNEGETVGHLRGALRAVPALDDGCPTDCRHPHQIVAATRLTYNIGIAAFTRSTVARRWNAGDWRGGCDAFLAWNKAGGREIRGLTLRRQRERLVCLRGLPS